MRPGNDLEPTEPKKRGRKMQFAGRGAPELRLRIADPDLWAALQTLGLDWAREALAKAVKREARKSAAS